MTKYKKIIFIVTLLTCIVIACCYTKDSITSITNTPNGRINSTNVSTALLLSATPMPMNTWTPLPTLSSDETAELVQGMLENNGGCRLPCWWGITPGITSWMEARQFFSTFATKIAQGGTGQITADGIIYQTTNYSITYDIPDISGGGGVNLSLQNGIVSVIEVGPNSTTRSFQLYRLLSEYGPPGKVSIMTYQDASGYPPPFIIVLFYPENHFLASFETDAKKIDDTLVGCPESVGPWLQLWSVNREVTNKEIEDWVLGPDPNNELKELSAVTDLSIDEFMRVFGNPENSDCIVTPAKYWP